MTIKKRPLEEIVDNFDGSKILVIGDVMIDHYLNGSVKRISPEAPVPIVNITNEYNTLGGSGNVAANIAALNTTANFLSVAGYDDGKLKLDGLLKQHNIQGTIIEEKNRPTTVKSRIVGMSQQLLRFDYETTADIKEKTERKILSELELKYLKNLSVIIISDYKKGVVTKNLLKNIISLSNKHNIKTIIDPKPETINFCKDSYLITPNNHEASTYLNALADSNEDVVLAGKTISRRLKNNVLITRGEYGMALFEQNKKPFLIPTEAKHVYDVTGAGDTSIALIALSLTANATLQEATIISNVGAGLVVQKQGTQTITPDELKKELSKKYF